MSVTAIIQARMGSTRLRGKILKKVNGKSLLLHQIESLKKCKNINKIVIATTIESQDDEVESFCETNNILVYRGSENNVLARYYDTWRKFGGDIIVRLTADCPMIDPKIVDETIQMYMENNYDYVSNTIERSFPRGLDTEVFSSETLEKVYYMATLERDKEHVTSFIYTHKELFKIGSHKNVLDRSKYRWTVDTEEDFELIRKIINKSEDYSNLDLNIKLMEENPNWFNINAHIEQKEI